MRYAKGIHAYVPLSVFNDLPNIAKEFELEEEYLVRFLWVFQQAIAKAKDKNKENFPISIPRQSLFSIKKDYKKYIAAWIESGYICIEKNYHVASGLCRQYAYTDKVDFNEPQKTYVIYDKKIIKSLIKSKEQIHYCKFINNRKSYLRLFKLEIDNARKWLFNNQEGKSNVWAHEINFQLSLINLGHRRFFKDEYGREHTSFTNLPRYIRQNFIRHNQAKTIEIDIPCSQPSLLYLLLKENSNLHLEDFENMLREDFYEVIKKEYNFMFSKSITREEAKIKTIKFLFDQTRDNDISNLFYSKLPDVYIALKDMKERKGYKHVSHLLQRKESVVMESICKEMDVNNINPFLTIYDSVSVLKSNEQKGRNIFYNKLKECGFNWL